jgi:hypothetical protein
MPCMQHLSFSEELMLLIVDDDTRRLHLPPEKVLGRALGGTLFLKLAFAGRLDNDVENVLWSMW